MQLDKSLKLAHIPLLLPYTPDAEDEPMLTLVVRRHCGDHSNQSAVSQSRLLTLTHTYGDPLPRIDAADATRLKC